GGFHFFMRVGESLTYDLTRGAGAHFAGMTRDGSQAYFLTRARLTPDDTDSLLDLYMWQESGDSLTLVSQGNGRGNSEACAPTWSDACAVALLEPERGHPSGNVNIPALDDEVAAGAGDVYFYSPDLLDPGSPGIVNQRNLYVYHDGSVHLVATLEPGTEVDRIQISTDGSHAAFLTASRLTSYDNRGFKEMYTY